MKCLDAPRATMTGSRGIVIAVLVLAFNELSLRSAAWNDAQLLDKAAYDFVLDRRHFDLTRDQLIVLGEQEYRRIEREMIALARTIDPSKTWHEILRRFEQTSHPKTTDAAIAAYTSELRRAKAFVLEKDLVTLPSAPELPVRETPPNLAKSVAYAI